MILIGNDLIPYKNITKVNSVEDISLTKPNEEILFTYDEKLLKYCFDNSLESIVIVSSIKEAIFSNALNAKYILSDIQLCDTLQKIADNYMFDSKILAIIKDDNQLEELALKGIDGVFYRSLLK